MHEEEPNSPKEYSGQHFFPGAHKFNQREVNINNDMQDAHFYRGAYDFNTDTLTINNLGGSESGMHSPASGAVHGQWGHQPVPGQKGNATRRGFGRARTYFEPKFEGAHHQQMPSAKRENIAAAPPLLLNNFAPGQQGGSGPAPNIYVRPDQLAAVQAFLEHLSSFGSPVVGNTSHNPQFPRVSGRAMTVGSFIPEPAGFFERDVPRVEYLMGVDLGLTSQEPRSNFSSIPETGEDSKYDGNSC